MARIEARMKSLGLVLPPPTTATAGRGAALPLRARASAGARWISGHGPQNADGSFALPLGKLGRELTVEQGYVAARLTALSMLGSLQRALGDLDRIGAWTRVFGMVNSASGFNRQPSVINGFSDLILELFGPEVRRAQPQRGGHGRTALRHPGGNRSRGRAHRLRARRRAPDNRRAPPASPTRHRLPHLAAAPMRLALFDLDHTLLSGDSDVLWCDFLLRAACWTRASASATDDGDRLHRRQRDAGRLLQLLRVHPGGAWRELLAAAARALPATR